jgi:hypothetical protein
LGVKTILLDETATEVVGSIEGSSKLPLLLSVGFLSPELFAASYCSFFSVNAMEMRSPELSSACAVTPL